MKQIKLISLILIALMCLFSVTAFASADVLEPDFAGNTDALIDIKNPEAAQSTTTSTVCVISAVAAEGTKVTLYKLDATSGKYAKLLTPEGAALESVVGAAGLYAQNLELTYGTNNLMVVATSGELTEAAKLEITVIKPNLIDTIRNIWQNLIN